MFSMCSLIQEVALSRKKSEISHLIVKITPYLRNTAPTRLGPPCPIEEHSCPTDFNPTATKVYAEKNIHTANAYPFWKNRKLNSLEKIIKDMKNRIALN
jgi:hypothetical protein